MMHLMLAISVTLAAGCAAEVFTADAEKDTRGVEAAVTARATFTRPECGETIAERANFLVGVEIPQMREKGSYWVAIASVRGHDEDWDRLLELRKRAASGDEAAAGTLQGLLSRWQADLFWPKYFVDQSPKAAPVFDGGMNPLAGLEPQPMLLLLLEVDDTLQGRFRSWLRDGGRDGRYPGIPAGDLAHGMVVARCEIFFP